MIINVSLAAHPHIMMISEGSCDTEDWRNDAENAALITELHLTIFSDLNIKNIYLKKNHNVAVFTISCKIPPPTHTHTFFLL